MSSDDMEEANFTIYCGKAVRNVKVCEPDDGTGNRSQNALNDATAQVNRLCRTLNRIIENINSFQPNISEHREAIARLSVEIARKILAKDINERDYKIENIVKEALKNAPAQKDIVICVNPQDYTQLRKLQTDSDKNLLERIELVADSEVGCAECVIKTPKGTVKSLIQEHLERIAHALTGEVN